MNKEEIVTVYGVKGFDSNLKCRDFQYHTNHLYVMPIENVKICSFGFHFSPTLYDASTYYGVSRGNRFCIVKAEIPLSKYANWCQDKDKIVSNNIEIIKELSQEEIMFAYQEEKTIRQADRELTKDEIFGIQYLKAIQTAYPNFVVGGSVALFLQGFGIKREIKVGDFDLIVPHYQLLKKENFTKDDLVTEVDTMDDGKNSGNDFDYTNGITIDGEFILLDMKIDPKAKYKEIIYDDFTFKVCPWEVIIQAKMNYMNTKSGAKHKKDLLEMFGNPVPQVKVKEEPKLTSIQNIIKSIKTNE